MATSRLSFTRQKKVVRMDSWSPSGLGTPVGSALGSHVWFEYVWIRWIYRYIYYIYKSNLAWRDSPFCRFTETEVEKKFVKTSYSLLYEQTKHERTWRRRKLSRPSLFRASQSPGLITLITHSSCREFDAPEPSKARLTKIVFLYADLDLQVDIVCVYRIDLSGRYWYLDAETCELKTIYTAQYLRPSRSFT